MNGYEIYMIHKVRKLQVGSHILQMTWTFGVFSTSFTVIFMKTFLAYTHYDEILHVDYESDVRKIIK
jgi:hypothetical protein